MGIAAWYARGRPHLKERPNESLIVTLGGRGFETGYADEMQNLRRQLFEKHWPQLMPQVKRHIMDQGQPLSRVQVEAFALYMEETFHLGQVDRRQLQRAADELASQVLQQTGWMTLDDCAHLTPKAFERLATQLFLLSGYHPTMAAPQMVGEMRIWQLARTDSLPIGVVAVLGSLSAASVSRLKLQNQTIVVLTPSEAGHAVKEVCRNSAVQIIDAQGLAALLEKYPVARGLITEGN